MGQTYVNMKVMIYFSLMNIYYSIPLHKVFLYGLNLHGHKVLLQ